MNRFTVGLHARSLVRPAAWSLVSAAALSAFSGAPLALAPASAQDIACAVPAPTEAPLPSPRLGELHRFATGAGVTVAVIDTGVARHPQLPRLIPGADFVTPEDPQPFTDCDVHGTVVAGIIASTSGGIAPGVEIVSIRQSSAHYRLPRAGGISPGQQSDDDTAGVGNLDTLAGAIDSALDSGARVINMSVVSCVEPAVAPRVDTRGIEAALARAEREGAVVVAAAGNANHDCPPGSTVFPAHFPTVLAVGARADNHTMADYSLPVPPAKEAVSAAGTPDFALAPGGPGWAAGTAGDRGVVYPFAGTSFAAPVVSGTVALLRERYPEASPALIRDIVYASAEPNGGAVDPLRTLTFVAAADDFNATRPPLRIEPVERELSIAPERFGFMLAAAALSVSLALIGGTVARLQRAR